MDAQIFGIFIILLKYSLGSGLDSCQLSDDNLSLICREMDTLERFPEIASDVKERLRNIDIQNQPRLVHLGYNDLHDLDAAYINITHTGLKSIESFAFHHPGQYKDNLTLLSLRDNNITRVDWRSFSLIRSAYHLDLKENPLDCDCSALWLAQYETHLNPRRYAAPPVVGDQPYFTSTLNLFHLPKTVAHSIHDLCPQKHWGKCPKPKVTLDPQSAILNQGDDVTFRCTLTEQKDKRNLHMLGHIQFMSMRNVTFTDIRHDLKEKWLHPTTLELTYTITNISRGDMGWFACQSWRSDYPEYQIGALAVLSKPRIRIRQNSLPGTFVFRLNIRIDAYPLNVMNGEIVHDETKWTVKFTISNNTIDKTIISNENGSDDQILLMLEPKFFYRTSIHFNPSVYSGFKLKAAKAVRLGKYTIKVCNEFGCGIKEVFFNKFLHSHPTPPPMDKPRADSSTASTQHPQAATVFQEPVYLLAGGLAFLACLSLGAILFLIYWKARKKPRKRRYPIEEEWPLQEIRGYEWELRDITHIKKDDLAVIRELGQGAFGEVFLAYWTERSESPRQASTLSVAVKVLRDFAPQYRRDFQREASLMAKLSHNNVVQFFGICIDGVDLLLVYEYMDQGDLKAYLRKNGPNARYLFPADQILTSEQLTMTDLLRLACMAVSGLSYLTKMRVVHRDLAARNCLLTGEGPLLKLSDFGMSRDLYCNEYYRIQNKRVVLPVRWLPPESLVLGKFTHESDIWSFGILLWEIFTFGQIPYPHMSNEEVLQAAKNGLSPSQPDSCPIEIYRLMRRCWEQVPSERIQVNVLEPRLDEMLQHSLSATDDLGYLTCEFS